MKAELFVRFRRAGFHHWPNPISGREYLRERHRHQFHVEVKMVAQHDDREVEFHDLLDAARALFPGGELGSQSCEMMARKLAAALADEFGRSVAVTISEDGECGSTVTCPGPEPTSKVPQ